MEEYVVHCEKAIKTGKKTDLPKTLQTKLEEQQRALENQALAKASSQPKAAGIEPSPSLKISTTIIANASEQREKGNASAPKEKKKGEKEGKSNQSKEQTEVEAIPSDEESESELVNEEQEQENVQGSAGMGPTAQKTCANTSATPMDADVQLAMEIDQQEQEVEVGETMDVRVSTQEELATAVAGPPTPTTDHT